MPSFFKGIIKLSSSDKSLSGFWKHYNAIIDKNKHPIAMYNAAVAYIDETSGSNVHRPTEVAAMGKIKRSITKKNIQMDVKHTNSLKAYDDKIIDDISRQLDEYGMLIDDEKVYITEMSILTHLKSFDFRITRYHVRQAIRRVKHETEIKICCNHCRCRKCDKD